jgi:hypothetical protein
MLYFADFGVDQSFPGCSEVAEGTRKGQVAQFPLGVRPVDLNNHPWHAAIVNESNDLICGGTLISRTAVIACKFFGSIPARYLKMVNIKC